jgi:hypothetical protein
MKATRKFVAQAGFQFQKLTPEELAVKLQSVPTSNLAVLRDAARQFAADLLPQDVELIVSSVTAEIDRRWA